MTAMFPKYPENAVKWNEYNKTLSLNGYTQDETRSFDYV